MPAAIGLGGLAMAAMALDSTSPSVGAGESGGQSSTASVTVVTQAPAVAPVATGVVGTSSLVLVLGAILAVGLVALIGAASTALLIGVRRRGGQRCDCLTREPARGAW